jgi:hypothetical protein
MPLKIMKNIIAIVCLLFCLNCDAAQTSDSALFKSLDKITQCIYKNLPDSRSGLKRSECEYFMVDITLDSMGYIRDIDIMRRNKSANYIFLEKVIPYIKQDWIPVKTIFRNVFIPVFFLFEDAGNDPFKSDIISATSLFPEFFPLKFHQSNSTCIAKGIYKFFSEKADRLPDKGRHP